MKRRHFWFWVWYECRIYRLARRFPRIESWVWDHVKTVEQ